MSTQKEQEIENLKAMYVPGRGWQGQSFQDITQKRNKLGEERRQAELERTRIKNRSKANAQKYADVISEASAEKRSVSDANAERWKTSTESSISDIREGTERARADLNPWRVAGVDALGKLQEKIENGPGEFTESPGYQFRLKEGQKAVARSAAARGGSLSGAALKASLRYGQGFASNEYANFLSQYYDSLEPLQMMSDRGMDASNRMGEYSMQDASRVADERYRGTNAEAQERRYGAESSYEGTLGASKVISDEEKAAIERDYGYEAWKAGEEF